MIGLNPRQFLNQWEAKPNYASYTRNFFCPLSQLKGVARNSDWLMSLFAPVVIDQSNYFFNSHLKNASSWKSELQIGPSQLIFLTKFKQQRGRLEKFSLDLQKMRDIRSPLLGKCNNPTFLSRHFRRLTYFQINFPCIRLPWENYDQSRETNLTPLRY